MEKTEDITSIFLITPGYPQKPAGIPLIPQSSPQIDDLKFKIEIAPERDSPGVGSTRNVEAPEKPEIFAKKYRPGRPGAKTEVRSKLVTVDGGRTDGGLSMGDILKFWIGSGATF